MYDAYCRDIISPLLKVGDLRKQGITLHLLLDGEREAITDVPVLVGVGVSNAAQARQATRIADGVIQGASVVRRLMEHGPDAVGEYVAEVRSAIDD